MKPAVSIIVPVYNGEKTLERCVDSVLKQEYKDFELFLINDGSSATIVRSNKISNVGT